MTTTRFADLTARVASTIGLPDCRVAVIGHPLGELGGDGVVQRADAIVERVVMLLTPGGGA